VETSNLNLTKAQFVVFAKASLLQRQASLI